MAKNSPPPRRYAAPALDKGLDILECLADMRMSLSQLEIAQSLQRTPAEIYRMLMCLEERGYVVRGSKSGKFRLTLRLYELGHKQNAPSLLRGAARLPMEALADETGQACHLSVQHGTSLLVLMERMPARRVCLAVGEGTMLPLIETNSGHVLLSRMPEDVAADLLSREPHYAALPAAKQKAFWSVIDDARDRSCLVAASKMDEGIVDVAVPVGIGNTEAFGVLAIPCMAGRSSKSVRDAILRAATQINRNLGITQ